MIAKQSCDLTIFPPKLKITVHSEDDSLSFSLTFPPKWKGSSSGSSLLVGENPRKTPLKIMEELENYFFRKLFKLDRSAPQNGDGSSSSKRHRTEMDSTDLREDSDLDQNELKTFLKASLSVAQYQLRQGLVFHDRNELLVDFDDPIEEILDVRNERQFLGLLKFLGDFNQDIAVVLALYHDPHNLELAASDLRKDVISVAALETTNEILRGLGDAPFSLLIDETHDREGEAQMTVAVRYMDKRGHVMERFLGIEKVTSADALSLKKAVDSLCCRVGLRKDKLRGQGYGFADSVDSDLNGLKTLLLNENPCAHYVPSFAYKLQSVFVQLAWNHLEMCLFFRSLSQIQKVVGASCKHQDSHREKQDAKIVEALNIGEFPESADTGCVSHYSALVNLIGMFAEVIEDLELIYEEGSREEDQVGADMLLNEMLTFEFVFCLHLMKIVWGATNELSLAMEMKDDGIVYAMELVQVSKERLHMIRETGWTSLLEDVTSVCIRHEIKVPNMDDMYPAQGCRKREYGNMKNLHYYQVAMFYAIIDLQIQELTVRFTDSSIEMLLCVACLNPSNSFFMFDKEKLIRLAEFYPKEFSPEELVILRNQLDDYILDVCSNHGFSGLNTISELGKGMVETGRDSVYPLVFLLLTLALLLPVATATKAFSGMKLVKDRLSIEIGDKWMSDRLILSIEEDIFDGISHDTILQSLQKMKPRWADCKTLH